MSKFTIQFLTHLLSLALFLPIAYGEGRPAASTKRSKSTHAQRFGNVTWTMTEFQDFIDSEDKTILTFTKIVDEQESQELYSYTSKYKIIDSVEIMQGNLGGPYFIVKMEIPAHGKRVWIFDADPRARKPICDQRSDYNINIVIKEKKFLIQPEQGTDRGPVPLPPVECPMDSRAPAGRAKK